MNDQTNFNEFKKNIINDIKHLNKKNYFVIIKDVIVKKRRDGFEVVVYMTKDVVILDGAIAKIIYKYKPIFALCYGNIEVTVINSLNKKSCIRFTRRKYIE